MTDDLQLQLNIPVPTKFDGKTYSADKDETRLKSQLETIRDLMLDGKWRTIATVAQKSGATEAGASARLRDLRKERFGKYNVEKRRVDGGLWQYRIPKEKQHL